MRPRQAPSGPTTDGINLGDVLTWNGSEWLPAPGGAGALAELRAESFLLIPIPFMFPVIMFPGLALMPIGALDPISSPLVDSPAPGVLRYIGLAPRVVQLEAQALIAWTATTGMAVLESFYFALTVNGIPILRSYWLAPLDLAQNPLGFSAQALVLLNPGDVIQLGIGSGGVVAVVETIGVFGLSLIAS